jgi:hypothetical protein
VNDRDNDLITKLTKELDTYKNIIQPEGKAWHPHPRDATRAFLCPPDPDIGLHKLGCVMGKCECCPEYPIPEQEQGEGPDAPIINFEHYVPFTSCSRHGRLTVLGTKVCQQCELLPEGHKKGNISTRKEFTVLQKPIGTFHLEWYIPHLKRYAYHILLVALLSKQEGMIGWLRHQVLLNNPSIMEMLRDFAE